MNYYILVVMGLVKVDILDIMKEIDISTKEALAYAMYFDFLRSRGLREKWKHLSIRAFILSISELRKGYYSLLRKVKDEVLFRDISEIEKYQWLRGWIFYKDRNGQWWVLVDGETDDFSRFKKVYKELREQ